MNLEELKEKRERLKGYIEEMKFATQLCKDNEKFLAEGFLTYNLREIKMNLKVIELQIKDAEKDKATV